MNAGPASFDVWEDVPACDPELSEPHETERVWLGYVATEYVQGYGLMSCAYRATSYWQHGGNGNGVPMGAHDTADDAQQEIRDYWEV